MIFADVVIISYIFLQYFFMSICSFVFVDSSIDLRDLQRNLYEGKINASVDQIVSHGNNLGDLSTPWSHGQ